MTEAVKHTPAPWVLDGYNLSTVLHCTAERGSAEAKHTCGDYETIARCEGDNWSANAHLIAAAPELIDVVREMIPFLEEIARQRHPAWRPEMADRDSVLGRAYSAIAKVEGRS